MHAETKMLENLVLEAGMTQLRQALVEDNTAHVQADKAMAELVREVADRNKFVESIISNLQSGIIVVDLDFQISLVNSYVVELCGTNKGNLVGKNLNTICPELSAHLLAGKKVAELETRFCGNGAIIGYNRVDLTDAHGRLNGYIINLKDLTEIVRIRKELQRKERLSAMGEALARVAHEMRNPLFGMTAAAQILEMELKLDPAQKELMDSLLKDSRRLNKIIEELLDTTREVRIIKSNVNLASILDESLRAVAGICTAKGVLLQTDFAPEVWISADAHKLGQVIINLATNAIEATRQGGAVRLDLIHGINCVLVRIADNGEGILPENLNRVFDVFFTTKKNGTGLGLPICKSIVEAHGGSLTADNNPDGGAQFVMQLPTGDSRP